MGGHVRRSLNELANCARNLALDAKAVRAYAEQNFSVERMINDYIQLYSDILADRQTGVDAERIVA